MGILPDDSNLYWPAPGPYRTTPDAAMQHSTHYLMLFMLSKLYREHVTDRDTQRGVRRENMYVGREGGGERETKKVREIEGESETDM